MKIAIVVSILAVVSLASADEGKYTDKYDNTDIMEILHNKRLLDTYIECMVNEKARCPPEARELRGNIKDALETYCKKCTKVQEDWSRKVIGHLINNEPEYWQKLVAKYDPNHKYTVKYENELRTLKA